MKRKKIPYGTKLPVKLSIRERDLIYNEMMKVEAEKSEI